MLNNLNISGIFYYVSNISSIQLLKTIYEKILTKKSCDKSNNWLFD